MTIASNGEAIKRLAPEEGLKAAMRKVPSSVALVTSRDARGLPQGMAASAVISVSMEPASVLVSVNRSAGLHPTLSASGKLCINFLAHHQEHLLLPFSRSDLREQRFISDAWRDSDGPAHRLPWLPDACAVVFGDIDATVAYATHTLFIARVSEVLLPPDQGNKHSDAHPLVWLGGRSAPLACHG